MDFLVLVRGVGEVEFGFYWGEVICSMLFDNWTEKLGLKIIYLFIRSRFAFYVSFYLLGEGKKISYKLGEVICCKYIL